jgi:hypothetical protein
VQSVAFQQHEGALDEPVQFAKGWIRDENAAVYRIGRVIVKKIQTSNPPAARHDIGSQNVPFVGSERVGNGAIAGAWLPYGKRSASSASTLAQIS